MDTINQFSVLGYVIIWITIYMCTSSQTCIQISNCRCEQSNKRVIYQCMDIGLTNIPNGFPSQTTEINLSGNEITVLPKDMFVFYVKLEKIVIQNNKIKQLVAGTFDSLVNLKEINLLDNQIPDIPADIFAYNVKLEEVTLSRNKITRLPSGLFDTTLVLKSISLDQNSIDDVHRDLLDNIENLSALTINCFRCFSCSCMEFDLFVWLKNKIKELKYAGFYCRTRWPIKDMVKRFCDGATAITDKTRVTLYEISTKQEDMICQCPERNTTTERTETPNPLKTSDSLNGMTTYTTPGNTTKEGTETSNQPKTSDPSNERTTSYYSTDTAPDDRTMSTMYLNKEVMENSNKENFITIEGIVFGTIAGVLASAASFITIFTILKRRRIRIENDTKESDRQANLLVGRLLDEIEIMDLFERKIINVCLNVPPVSHIMY